MDFAKGEWKVEKRLSSQMPYGIFQRQGERVIPVVYIQHKEDANLIVAAVNACQFVNQDNPIAVADSIKDMYEALKLIVLSTPLLGEKGEMAAAALNKAEGKAT